jgi:hypothetical protein
MPSDDQPTTDHSPANPEDASRPWQTDRTDDLPQDVATAFERMERVLRQIRGSLDTTTREAKYREFSPLRLVGAVLQVFVAGLVVLALLDWFLAAPTDSLLIKLAFAAVLQLSALTAFVVSRHSR